MKEFGALKDIYYPYVKPRIGSVEKIREMMIERKREYSLNKEERGMAKRNTSSGKMKNKGGLQSLYAIMLLSKHPFCEDYAGSTQEKKVRIFNELMTRNRKNNDEINHFLELTGHCESAGKLPESVIVN